MKKNIFTIALLAVFTLGCSKETIDEPQLTGEVKTSLLETVAKLQNNKEFLNFMSERATMKQNDGGNGLIILTDEFNMGVAQFNPETISFAVLGGQGTIQQMRNGKAKFSIHSKDPVAAVFSFLSFQDVYTSNCIEGKNGVMNYNLISEYEEFSPFPGLVFYFPTFEGNSAEIANGHAQMGVPIYDDFGEIVDCADESQNKTMRLKAVWDANGENKRYELKID